MKYLLCGMESTAKINCLLALTKIDSERKIDALHAHFVKGYEVTSAAALCGLPQPKLTQAITKLNEIAGLCEKFHELKLYELK